MVEAIYSPKDRRPIASRELAVIKFFASRLAESSVNANQISVTSIIFSFVASCCLSATGFVEGYGLTALWFFSLMFIQLRLLANLLDGMVAISQQKASPVGELYNEVPDRVSDTLILIGLGLSVGGKFEMGLPASLFAMATAYIRVIGKAVGTEYDFCGPMAKQQRMFFVSLCCLLNMFIPLSWNLSCWTLSIISLGSLATAIRRLLRISEKLKNQGAGRA